MSFVIGCSFTFENALLAAGVPVRHIEQGVNVPMYRTNIACRPAGRFSRADGRVDAAADAGAGHEGDADLLALPAAHGAPVHFGDPAAIGIRDMAKPDFGDAVEIRPGEVPVFWACGVTPQAAVMQAKPPFAITHKPGHMFLTDLRDVDPGRGVTLTASGRDARAQKKTPRR